MVEGHNRLTVPREPEQSKSKNLSCLLDALWSEMGAVELRVIEHRMLLIAYPVFGVEKAGQRVRLCPRLILIG
jgi:hypothetical protein